jgi:pyruvate ferredoxin oxidoreductase gamma subunit
MLRIRFHGRGGHGMKTASRVLGTAGFLAGWHAQDSPVYGAERRGAAITAFTRLADDAILERGIVAEPDLILVADETLLADPTARVLTGAETATAVFVNSCSDAQLLASRHGIPCLALVLDCSAIATEHVGRSSALSSVLGAVACRLTGVIAEDVMVRAVREELASLGLPGPAIDRNVAAARAAFAAVRPVPIAARPQVAAAPSRLYRPAFVPAAVASPIVYATGNSRARHTGSWRFVRPTIDLNGCTRCLMCVFRCPDAAIAVGADGYPAIDYDNCKGCMICREECPTQCIRDEKEVRAW